MKLRVIIKEAVAPEEISARKQTAIQNINNELRGIDLDTLDLQQLQAILSSIQVAKGDQPAENLASLEEKKKKGAVSKKISTLRDEGKPQDQAVAIALDMERRGKLKEEEGDWFDRLIKWLTGTKAGNTVLDTANRRRGENQVSSAYKGKK